MDIPHYTLVEKKEVPEYHLTGYLFRHDLTGARLFFAIAPGDDNKVFSATFLTRPDNDCGVPHILEHCMLNGSDKYPVKEPFVELLKGSLNTFLNAMTFPDKTMFPVASRNDKDFENLMDVYLDAVFHPRLLKDPNIFRQEGWHMELNDENEPITYKGVVYNEMKGAYSDPETVLADLVEKAMYPDNAYSKDSGGNPEFIPDLTYDEFCAFYRKYYHPSNSYLFFYGDLDMEYYLDKVDKEYLSTFTKVPETLPAHIDLQRRFEIPVETYGSYGITEDDDPSRKTYLSYSVMLDPVTTAEDYYAIDMLAEIIGGVEASPLKKALIDAGIGQSISVSVDLSRQQPVFEIVAKNAEAFQKDDFVRIIRKTLSDCVQNGYDPDLVEATVASSEFTLREQNYGSTPPGLILNIMVMDSWLYGGDPMQNLFYEKALDHIHKTKGLFEDLTKRLILENHHVVVCVLKPQAGLTLRTEEKTARKLKEYKDSLTPDQIRQLVRTTKEFTAWQQKPDRAEDLVGMADVPQNVNALLIPAVRMIAGVSAKRDNNVRPGFSRPVFLAVDDAENALSLQVFLQGYREMIVSPFHLPGALRRRAFDDPDGTPFGQESEFRLPQLPFIASSPFLSLSCKERRCCIGICRNRVRRVINGSALINVSHC